MNPRTSVTKTLTCTPGELTAQMLLEFLTSIPSEAKVTIKTDYGDRPGEIGQTRVSATYSDA